MSFKLKYFSLIIIIASALAQESSGRQFRRTGIHNGNLVRTVFGNWGVVGQPSNKGQEVPGLMIIMATLAMYHQWWELK